MPHSEKSPFPFFLKCFLCEWPKEATWGRRGGLQSVFSCLLCMHCVVQFLNMVSFCVDAWYSTAWSNIFGVLRTILYLYYWFLTSICLQLIFSMLFTSVWVDDQLRNIIGFILFSILSSFFFFSFFFCGVEFGCRRFP